MTEDHPESRLNKQRLAAGRKMINAVRSDDAHGNLGDFLVRAYMKTGRGDEYDLRSTVVDIMADVCHQAAEEGIPFQDVVDGVDSAEPDAPSQVFKAMKDVLERNGHSYEDALWTVSNHLNVELRPAGMRH